MNGIECISISAAFITLVHFTKDTILCCFNEIESYDKINT